MKILYANKRVEEICTDVSKAKKYFGGDKNMANSLMSRINAIASADIIKDIIVQPQFSFHKLLNKGKKNFEGYFAIDVKTHKDKWRIILEPLDDESKPFNPCKIDEISNRVRIVEILEVSNHYE